MEQDISQIKKSIDSMQSWMTNHGEEDDQRHNENLGRFDNVGAALNEIKTNHLRHIQDDTEELQQRSTEMSTDIWWIKWLLMGLVSGIGLIIVGVLIAVVSAKL